MHFVLDNGTFEIKAGFDQVLRTRNLISRTRDGSIHIGSDYLKHQNNLSGISFKRPFEQGHLTLWETEKPIWDSIFDGKVDPSECHLTLAETPFQLPQLSINTDAIVFEEYGFQSYFRTIPAALIPWSLGHVNEHKEELNHVTTQVTPPDFSFIIDCGYLATWIVPVIRQKVYWKAVKKFPIGGKALDGLLRELISLRHYDVGSEPVLVSTIKESTAQVATQFGNHRPATFVLPDFNTTATGYLLLEKTKISSDMQTLSLKDEHYLLGEGFFHPEIIFDASTTSLKSGAQIKSIIDLMVESIMACPETVRPLLLGNVAVVGGTARLPNLEQRLISELRRELPLEWPVKVVATKYPKEEMAWNGGRLLSPEILSQVSITKEEYFEHGANWCQSRFGFRNK